MKILIYIESTNNKIHPVSLESLVAAQKLSKSNHAEIYAVIFNKNLSDTLANYKLNGLIVADNDELSNYHPLLYLEAFEQINRQYSPNLIIFGHTYETRDWVPRLSARLDIPFVSDCIGLNSDGSFTRPTYQAKLNEKIALNNKGIISFQAGSFNSEDLTMGDSNIDNLEIDFSSINLTIRPGKKFRESANEVDLSSAEIILSVGRGIAKEENIPLAEQLAKKLNAQIAASRPVVDSGWLDHSRQVGSSGQVVSPKLYFSIGISGAIQHLVGMKGSKNIIAINKDPNAPIFEIADYAVIGDLFEILPKLTEQL